MTLEIAVALLAIVVTVMGGFISAALGIFAWVVRRNEKLQDDVLASLQGKVVELDTDVNDLKTAIARYEPLVGAGKEGLDHLHEALQEHVTKEEQIFWKKIEAVSDAQRIANEAILQRITAIEARMPNGELKEMVKSLTRVEAGMISMKEELARVGKHVEEHEDSSESWKQRIVALETAVNPPPPPRKPQRRAFA